MFVIEEYADLILLASYPNFETILFLTILSLMIKKRVLNSYQMTHLVN